jgi:hypothetical protein
MEWLDLAQDRGRWRDVVHAVMDLRVLAPRSHLLLSRTFCFWLYFTEIFCIKSYMLKLFLDLCCVYSTRILLKDYCMIAFLCDFFTAE